MDAETLGKDQKPSISNVTHGSVSTSPYEAVPIVTPFVSAFQKAAMCLALVFLLSGCGDSNDREEVTNTEPPTLIDLSLRNIALEQTFQSNQFEYTASVGYLSNLTAIAATANEDDARLSVNGLPITGSQNIRGRDSPLSRPNWLIFKDSFLSFCQSQCSAKFQR